ncbi:MAG: ATP-binding protein [Bacillota bacterium]|nr:ATP-binding protein [Bacillota bacterium]
MTTDLWRLAVDTAPIVDLLREPGAIWLVVFGFLLALSLLALIVLLVFMNRRRRTVREIGQRVEQHAEERVKAEAIISDLDIGLIAYGRDGRLTLSNPAASRLLGLSTAVPDFDRFMTEYGEANGLRTRFILGRGNATATLVIGDRILSVTVTEDRSQTQGRIATIVTLQDITIFEQQEQQRKEFVANVSHELKTPLTTMITYSESLLDWGLNEKSRTAVRKDISRIHDDACRMERLVTDLLLLSSIDSRKMPSRMEPLDLVPLLQQTVDRMQIPAHEKDINMKYDSMGAAPAIYGDRSSLERIFQNILSNAIKYTDRGGRVDVYSGQLDDQAYIKVSDNGYGIERKHLPKIFDRFYRVDATGSRHHGGTGLGLAIVRELLVMHHGSIDVSSALGQGTTVTVMLPLARTLYRSALGDLDQGLLPEDALGLAIGSEIIVDARERGWDVEQLTDLSRDQIATLLSQNQEPPVPELAIIDESSADGAPLPATELPAEQQADSERNYDMSGDRDMTAATPKGE